MYQSHHHHCCHHHSHTIPLPTHPHHLQDFVAATIQAYLATCDVAAGSFRKYPAYIFPSAGPPGSRPGSQRQAVLAAEQWTLRRSRSLTESELAEQEAWEGAGFVLDLCPAGSSDGMVGCY